MYFRDVVVSSETDALITVNIHFTDEVVPQQSFEDFLERWIAYYEAQTPFRFVIHTREIREIPSLWLSLRMAWFLYMLKLRYPKTHYLRESHILVQNVALRRLLECVFAIQSPVAPVYLYMTDDYTKDLEPETTILP